MQVVGDNKKCHYEISLNKHVTRDLPTHGCHTKKKVWISKN